MTPIKKLHSSPAPPVVDMVRFTRFLIKHTTTPLTGPMEKAAIRAGSSEKSSLIKLGMMGRLKLMNISTVATALKMAVMAIFRTLTFFCMEPSLSENFGSQKTGGGGEKAQKIPEPRKGPGAFSMKGRYSGSGSAAPKNLLSSGLCRLFSKREKAVHRRCWNFTSSAERETSPFADFYCRSGIAPCPEVLLLVSF